MLRLDRNFVKAATLALIASCCLAADAALGADEQEIGQAEAESRLARVREDIDLLKQQLEEARTEHRKEQANLKALDLEIHQADLNLRDLEQQRGQHLAELDTLRGKKKEYLESLSKHMDQLAEQVRIAYRSGRQSRIKLILNQDDLRKLGRMLAYYEFFNRAQVRAIAELRQALTELESMQQSIDEELSRIAEVQTRQTEVMELLHDKRRSRQDLIAQLGRRINSGEDRLRELERNRRDLEALIERLVDVLADIPPELGQHAGVASQRGQLPMPLRGPVRQAFGQPRGGMKWQGWLIGAKAGAEVHSIAYGRVAFADWLRGYGLLMIIDHGDGYMSLYGQNESLLREVGAWVQPGEVISIVGSNAGNAQGLYFELRKNGKALDPAPWLSR